MDYIPTIISACSLAIVFATFVIGRGKDHDTQKENNIKINLKLDQLCTSTNQILIKFEKHEEKIQNLETELAILERDIKTAFNRIDEIKESHHER